MKALLKNKKLENLSLDGNRLTTETAVRLGRVLTRCTTLKIICLEKNIMTDTDANSIARGLANNDSLQNLFLGDNKFGYEGEDALRDALIDKTDIGRLHLS